MAASSGGERRVQSGSVTDHVTAELRRSILRGALEPGRQFSLREVAGMLEVSFIPVRDALRHLEGEGLVVMRPGRSAVVAPLDLDDLRAIYRLRRTIEPEIAGRACLLLPDSELDELEELAISFGDETLLIDEIYDAHHEFHLALLAPASSAWDERLLNTLWRAAERYLRIGFGTLDPDLHEHHRRRTAHVALVIAFRLRDPIAAAQAVREHLEHNEQIALRALVSRGAAMAEHASPGPARRSASRKLRARST